MLIKSRKTLDLAAKKTAAFNSEEERVFSLSECFFIIGVCMANHRFFGHFCVKIIPNLEKSAKSHFLRQGFLREDRHHLTVRIERFQLLQRDMQAVVRQKLPILFKRKRRIAMKIKQSHIGSTFPYNVSYQRIFYMHDSFRGKCHK